MVVDEPAMWNLIPEAKRERVICAAKAMCRSKDACDDEGDETVNHCAGCDTPTGGSCVAFGIYGQMAVEVIEALDGLAQRRGLMSPNNQLADRIEKATGPDRELDAAIAEAYGWKPAPCPPDANGENAGEVLTPDGQPFRQPNGDLWRYPPIGKVHRAYHVPEYTRDCRDPAFPRDAIRQQTAAALRARQS